MNKVGEDMRHLISDIGEHATLTLSTGNDSQISFVHYLPVTRIVTPFS